MNHSACAKLTCLHGHPVLFCTLGRRSLQCPVSRSASTLICGCYQAHTLLNTQTCSKSGLSRTTLVTFGYVCSGVQLNNLSNQLEKKKQKTSEYEEQTNESASFTENERWQLMAEFSRDKSENLQRAWKTFTARRN